MIYVVIFSILGGLFSLIGGLLLLGKNISANKLVTYATPFAAGSLLAAVFLDLLPEAAHVTELETVMIALLAGILLFFMAERFLHWFHHHHQHEDSDPSVNLIIVGDTLHNALDGVAIAAAFLISVPTGIVTALAVAAHELPQEIGDFGLLLAKGVARKKVIVINVMSSLATTVTAVIVYALGSTQNLPIGVFLGLSAGFLLYIAMSDIIPEIHERTSSKKLFDWQPVMLILGVVIVAVAINLSHSYLEAATGEVHDSHSKQIDHAETDHGHDSDDDSDHSHE